MNDLKTEKKELVEKYLASQIARLIFAYGQEIDFDQMKKMLKFIVDELIDFNTVNESTLNNAYKELMRNYTVYRKINGASYITAYYKHIKK